MTQWATAVLEFLSLSTEKLLLGEWKSLIRGIKLCRSKCPCLWSENIFLKILPRETQVFTQIELGKTWAPSMIQGMWLKWELLLRWENQCFTRGSRSNKLKEKHAVCWLIIKTLLPKSSTFGCGQESPTAFRSDHSFLNMRLLTSGRSNNR